MGNPGLRFIGAVPQIPGIAGGSDFALRIRESIYSTDAPTVCGWVIDLRRNSGGTMPGMLQALRPILGDSPIGGLVDASGALMPWTFPAEADAKALRSLAESDPAVALLIGRLTAGAGEGLVVAFRGRANTRTFGEPTWGLGSGVTPIALPTEEPDQDQSSDLDRIWSELPYWWPGRVRDQVQRVRNYLFIPAVIDVFQMSIERFVPALIFERLQTDIPKDDLIKILYWIAIHPTEGTDEALDQLRPFGIGNGPSDVDEVRQRAAVYGVKLLGRLIGKIKDTG